MALTANKHVDQVDPTLSVIHLTVDSTTATQLKAYQQSVRCTVSASRTIKLPPLGEAAGRVYTIYYLSGTGTLTIVDAETSTTLETQTVAGSGTYSCNGYGWTIIST